MMEEKSLSRYILVVLCLSVVFTTLVLIALNAWTRNRQLSLNTGIPAVDQIMGGQSYEDGYKNGYNTAREKFRRLPPMPENISIQSISGPIISITDNSIIVKATNLDTDPIADGVADERTVYLDPNTKIVRNQYLDSDAYLQLISDWNTSASNKTTPPPLSYKEFDINIKDLKIDDTVTVTASTDIRLSGEFTAEKISANN